MSSASRNWVKVWPPKSNFGRMSIFKFYIRWVKVLRIKLLFYWLIESCHDLNLFAFRQKLPTNQRKRSCMYGIRIRFLAVNCKEFSLNHAPLWRLWLLGHPEFNWIHNVTHFATSKFICTVATILNWNPA